MKTASWTYLAEPPSVAELRRRIVAFAAEQCVADPPLADLKLAVSEAATNAVLHAFQERETPGSVTGTVEIDTAAGRVRVVVSDDGAGMMPRPDSPGLGLGLPLISQVTDEIAIRPGPDGVGTEVHMVFTLGDSVLN